jgi:phage-related protein
MGHPRQTMQHRRGSLPSIQLARPVNLFELRVKQFDRIFRIFFFYQPGMLIVITSGFQKKSERTPPCEIARAEQLRKLWIKHRNHYTGSLNEREAIVEELGR